MLAFIVSDNQSAAENLRRILVDQRIDCGIPNVLTTDRALNMSARFAEAAELVFVILSAEVDRALSLITSVRKNTRANLVAVGSARDPQCILRVVQAGSDSYLDEDGDLADQVRATVERLQVQVREEGTVNGEVITITASNGGTGRSTTAANLAFGLAEHGRCCLIDLDLRRGDLASMVNVKPRHTIVDVCSNTHSLDEHMFQDAICDCGNNVHLLAAPQSLDDVQQVTTDGVEQVLQFARAAFDYVVVDLEDFFHREQFRVLQLSDVILFMLRIDFNGLRNTRRTVEFLRQAGVDKDKLQLVANQSGRPKELSAAQAEDALGAKIAYFIPDDPKTQNHSLNSGVPAIMESPRSKLARAIRQLTSVRADSVKA